MRPSLVCEKRTEAVESPRYVRLSLAAAMTLGFARGWFYRNARLGCVNLLLTYDSGCKAHCAFCGLADEKGRRKTGGSFIRVPWRAYPVDAVIEALESAPAYVSRVCISMITHARARRDVLEISRAIALRTGKAVSLLISPSVLKKGDLQSMKDAGAERIGVAIDCATEELFVRYRGRPVRGPHTWHRYWKTYEESLAVFGEGMAGAHFICGLGETESEMAQAISRSRGIGGSTHLFSFFPEPKSALAEHLPPPIGSYRRIQLARWLIDHDLTRSAGMQFDSLGRIVGFGASQESLQEAIGSGSPFETSGCPGPDGKVACNRPYGNEKPGKGIRNFPFPPDADDVARIRVELQQYE
jgi:biotin synthase-related radical SAM superfamily protein